MDVTLYQKPFDRQLGDLYVRDYIEVFPLKEEDVSFGCNDCYRKAYSKLVWHLNKQEMKKYEFLGKKDTIYNFPSIKIYGVTTENITDEIAQKLFEAKSPYVKLTKEVKKAE